MRVSTEPSADRLPEPVLHVLLSLGDEAMHGYAIMRAAADRTNGRVRLLPGTLYSTIKKMLADRLVEECVAPRDADSDDARRRYYRVTKAGRAAAVAETQRLAMLVKLGQVFVK